MFTRRKPIAAAAALSLVLSVAAAHAEPPSPSLDSTQPNADAPPDQTGMGGNNLTQRGLTAVDHAANRVSAVLGTSAQAFGTGVQRVTNQATALIEHAKQALGVPYRWGGTSAQSGFDCSGFVRAMVQETVGKLLPHHAADQAAVTQKISKNELRPGDLVFFHTVRRHAYSHVGIYMGDGRFIHAPARGQTVRIDNLSEAYWQRHFEAARRVLTTSDRSFPGSGLSASADTTAIDSASPKTVASSFTASSGATSTDSTSRTANAGRVDHVADTGLVNKTESISDASATSVALASAEMASGSVFPMSSSASGNAQQTTAHKRHGHAAAKHGRTAKRTAAHHGGKKLAAKKTGRASRRPQAHHKKRK